MSTLTSDGHTVACQRGRDVTAVLDVRDRAERLLTDFPYYAEHCLTIRPKAGGLAPLVLNSIQRTVHGRLEEQIRRTGRVRALILEARIVRQCSA